MKRQCQIQFGNYFLNSLEHADLKETKCYLSLEKRGNQTKVLRVLNEPKMVKDQVSTIREG